MTASERLEFDRLLSGPIWVPQPGPQTDAYVSEADELFYGGAAGGGKSELMIGLALTSHDRSLLLRREHQQLKAMVDRIGGILGGRDGFNAQDKRWRLKDGRVIDFGGVQFPGDEQAYQGQPHDLIAFDEVTSFLESQYRFISAWNRSAKPGQRCRIVAAGNPPTDTNGEWVIRRWGPWLDPEYSGERAAPGELRWFATSPDGVDVEVDGPGVVDLGGEKVFPRSRTFIPSSVDDNLFLATTNYKAVLQSLPEPLRSQMLNGDFSAGREDSPWQVIPTEWVRQAQARWTPDRPRGARMDALGVDVARGGKDKTILSSRFDVWFDKLREFPGSDTPDGTVVAGYVAATLRDKAPVYIDVIGVGASAHDHLVKVLGVKSIPVDARVTSWELTKAGTQGFFNRRSELWWRFREALDPSGGCDLALPPDREILVELCTPRWKPVTRNRRGAIQVEGKEDIRKRIGRSTDRADALIMSAIGVSPTKTDRREEESAEIFRPRQLSSSSWMR